MKKFLENSKLIFKKYRLKVLGFLAGCILIFGPRIFKFTDDIFRNVDNIKQVVSSSKLEDNLEIALEIYDGLEKSRSLFGDETNYPYSKVYSFVNNCYNSSKKVDSCFKETEYYFKEKIGPSFYINHRIKTAFEQRIWFEDFLNKASIIGNQEEFESYWATNEQKIPYSISDSIYAIIQKIRVNKIELDASLKSTQKDIKEIDSLFEAFKTKEK